MTKMEMTMKPYAEHWRNLELKEDGMQNRTSGHGKLPFGIVDANSVVGL